MLVERRNGELLIVAENKRGICFIKKDYSCGCTLEEYDLCLKNIYDCNKDIVKVYDLSKEIAPCFDIKDRALIFNRYKEVFLSLDEIREKFELDKDVATIIN